MPARFYAQLLLALTVITAGSAYSQEQTTAQTVGPVVPSIPTVGITGPDPVQPDVGQLDSISVAPGESPAVMVIDEDTQQGAGPARTESAVVDVPVSVIAEQSPLTITAPTAPVLAVGREERTRSVIFMIAAAILILTLAALIILLFKRSLIYKQAAESGISEALLYDLNGITSTPSYKLGQKPTMLGRVAGKDAGHLDYVVISESTIGRRHATIEYKDYAYWIMDQGSINGTFVNDVRINSETRLKHGDRIRLHKIEFDFVMPDMEAAGMTRVAEPGVANMAAPDEIDIEAVKSSMASDGYDLDFDFSGGQPSVSPAASGREEETLIPGLGAAIDESSTLEQEEVTLMPDFDHAAGRAGKAVTAQQAVTIAHNDETLMPDRFDALDGEDPTLRPTPNSSSNDIFDVTGAEDDKQR